MSSLRDEPDVPEKRRVIRYVNDEESQDVRGIGLSLTRSLTRQTSQMSIRSARSASRARDPALALPVQYRTL